MKRFSFVLCLSLLGGSHAFWKELNNIVPDAINPLNLLYTNRTIEDLGSFYTGPPFFHPTNRPLSLPPSRDARVKFLLFTPSNPSEEYLLQNTPESLANSTFDSSLPTKLVIHGFLSDVEQGDVRFEIKDALLEQGNYNVILVDWTYNNGPPYAQAVANTRVVGAKVARLVNFLVDEGGISAEDVHLIGHSLGGHTAGYAGERIRNLGRITGLDPAGPYFQDAEPEVRLDYTDANFVDVIHTDGAEFVLGGLGINDPIGHMDFYPNGGRLQLGCVYTSSSENFVGSAVNFTTKWLASGCDHNRANTYFLESIKSANCSFKSVKCTKYTDYEKGLCPPDDTTVAPMGFHNKKIPDLETPAKFFLRTTAESPFCLDGSIYI